MIDLSAAQAVPLVTKLLASPESRSLDFKRVSGKMIHRALETICAFANTEGGALVLGVDDPAKARGAALRAAREGSHGRRATPIVLPELGKIAPRRTRRAAIFFLGRDNRRDNNRRDTQPARCLTVP